MISNYQQLLHEALLEVVKKILTQVQQNGLSENQHFYISFYTGYSGVILSPLTKSRYPQEITIVLQNQFENLSVLGDAFTVRLEFNGVPETIRVPFASIRSFVDPSVNFQLEFDRKVYHNIDIKDTNTKNTKINQVGANHIADKKENSSQESEDNVILFDKFRNKNN